MNQLSLSSLIIISSITLTACEPLASKLQLGPKLGIQIPLEEIKKDDIVLETHDPLLKTDITPMFGQLDNKQNLKISEQIPESEAFIGSGNFIAKKVPRSAIKTAVNGKYSLNFDGADIGEVVKIILSDMLQENYLISPKVGGTITLQTTQALHKNELLPTLEMLLRMNGSVLIKRGGIYRIEADANSVQVADVSQLNSKKIASGYQIKVIPLNYVGAIDMAEIIKPVVPGKAIIKIDPARNILLVSGTQNELRKILDLVNTFDVNFIKGMSFGLYPLENTDVDSTVTQIEEIFNKGDKNPLSGMLRFISIKHMNAILVVTQQKEYLKEAEKWIIRLDKANQGVGEGGVIVYRVQHVDAVELASTLNAIVSGVASSGQRSASVSPGQRITRITNKVVKKVNKAVNRRSTSRTSQGTASLEGVNIIADDPNNALIIMAQPQQYRTLHKIIKQLDVMPLQVLIDATIVSVKLNDGLEYGVQWQFQNDSPSDNHTGIGLLGLAESAALAAGTGGFSYGLVNSQDKVRLLFNALSENKNLSVLSSPSLMVLNNHEATIKVGDQVPVRTSESTNLNGGANVQTSSIEMRDTGVTLKVKPRVNANGIIILEIEQNVDNASDTGSSKIDSPTILQRQIKTTIAVVSGESVVLGGLISETHTFNNIGIPLLKDLPFIGWLFGSQIKKVEKDELIVIITPQVIENKIDARRVTNEFKRKLTGIYYDKDDYDSGKIKVLRDYSGSEIIKAD